jgi:hypothetical protein
MKLKGLHLADVAEIQETVTDELKKVQKEEFSAALQRVYDSAKAYIYMPFELILNKKKAMCLSHVSSLFKNIRPITFGPHCTAKPTEVSIVRYNTIISQYIHILSNVKERFNHRVITTF